VHALLPPVARGVLAGLSIALLTLAGIVPMLLLALLKLGVPVAGVRRACDRAINGIARLWIGNNTRWIGAVNPRMRWDVRGVDGLRPDGWYLVQSNHQSWVDILVLQRVFAGRIPMLKFFLKQELIWVPVIGLAWWALDFPFMKRGRGADARGSDLRATRAACEKFKRIPTSVINFVEGTRFTPAKHAQQGAPYRHLLVPRIGGLGVALATLGERFDALLDVTLHYPGRVPTFWDLMTGRVDAVTVRVDRLPIPADLLGGDPQNDPDHRARLRAWVDAQWSRKDRLLDELAATPPR
jgi:1-acyl-sn-glycerol-3-phosphate acyltransferase